MEKVCLKNSGKEKLKEAIEALSELHEKAANLNVSAYPKNWSRILRAAESAVAEYKYVIKNSVPPTAEEVFRQKQAEMPDKELVELVSEKLSELCKSGWQSLTMTVPPRVDDFDMLVCELLRRFKGKVGIE